jgi:chromosome segregation ATPase
VLADLTARIDQLEKKMKAQSKKKQSSIDKILNRLNALETEYPKMKKAAEDRHAALERRVEAQGDQLARQQQPASSHRNGVPGIRPAVQSLPPRPPLAPYNHSYHQNRHQQYQPHGAR